MKYEINFKDIYNKESLYIYLKNVFIDYEFYGNNLDALMEVLICLKECEIIIENINFLGEYLGDYANKVKNTFVLASKENKNIVINFKEK